MEEKKVSWLELFFDLIFVTAVSFTTRLFIEIEHHPGQILFYGLEYLLMVFPMFWLWTGQTMLLNRFSQDIQRPGLVMMPQMFFFILMTASLDFNFNHTYHTYLLGYLGVRALTAGEYWLAARRLTGPRAEVAGLLGRLFIPGLIIPLASLLFEGRDRYLVMYSGIAADMILPLFFKDRLSLAPVNLPHLTERFGLFTLITFGEALVAVTSLLVGHTADYSALIFSGLSFLLIAVLWGSYFYGYEKVMDHHRETNGQALLYGHFFILVAVMLVAADVELLHDGELPRRVLIPLVYGPVILFLTAKHLVFYHHRKRGQVYYHREAALLIIALAAALAVNLIFPIPALGSLGLLIIICGLEAAVQSGAHRKFFTSRR